MTTRIRRAKGVPMVLTGDEAEATARHGSTRGRSTSRGGTASNRGTGAGKKTTRGSSERLAAAPKKKATGKSASRRPRSTAGKSAGKSGSKRQSDSTRKTPAKRGSSTRTTGSRSSKTKRKPSTQTTLDFDAQKPASRKVPESAKQRAGGDDAAADSTSSPGATKRTRVAPPSTGRRRASAESMAGKQREISVSEFFTKNRHLLGFDSPARALLTTVKEAVDNSLDAAEEAGILPSLRVELREVSESRFRVIVEDNGPGIVKAQVPKVFGKLLYGSKFHRLRQSRGQQGIGISAAGMYGQLTTGKPIVIVSRTGKRRPAHHFEIVIDTARNTPTIVKDETVEWEHDHGTRIEIELEGSYKAGRRSVDEYLEQVAIANPHAEILYVPPRDRPQLRLERAAEALPKEPVEIKPHPHGVELGTLQRILQDTKARTLTSALQAEFSRVSAKVANQIVSRAGIDARVKPKKLSHAEIERLHQVIPSVKIYAPPATCVVPIGEDLVRKGLEREIKADFYASSTRPPAVYRGNPFQVEAGLAYGGDLRRGLDDDDSPHATGKSADAQHGPITLLRLANRVPLQYQQSACATFRAVVETNWRQYGLPHPRGALPQGPMVLMVHIASVWVPFTSESKEAVAHYPEILKEIQLALKECGRKLGTFLRKREHAKREERRRGIFEMYIGELVESLGKLTRVDRRKLQKQLMDLAQKHTSDGNGNEDGDVDAAIQPTRRVRADIDEEEVA